MQVRLHLAPGLLQLLQLRLKLADFRRFGRARRDDALRKLRERRGKNFILKHSENLTCKRKTRRGVREGRSGPPRRGALRRYATSDSTCRRTACCNSDLASSNCCRRARLTSMSAPLDWHESASSLA